MCLEYGFLLYQLLVNTLLLERETDGRNSDAKIVFLNLIQTEQFSHF